MSGLYEFDRAALGELLADEPRYRVDQVWEGLYGRAERIEEMTSVPKALREVLADLLVPELTEKHRYQADKGETLKFLWTLEDGSSIESVLMSYADRVTVCVSTQAGCAMACEFCATGQAGFTRHLTTGEIVAQVIEAIRAARPRRVANVVFMGMGEPLANFDAVWAAVTRLHHDVGISARHLTLSTVGIVPGIKKLTAAPLPVNLAVSLHAANDRLRNRLVPINRRYPIPTLMQACADYVAAKHRRLSFEWALIDGVNDGTEDAQQLAKLALPLQAHINLIPLNDTEIGLANGLKGSPRHRVSEFRAELIDLGVNATVRINRGTDIAAACGQLAGGGTVVLKAPKVRS